MTQAGPVGTLPGTVIKQLGKRCSFPLAFVDTGVYPRMKSSLPRGEMDRESILKTCLEHLDSAMPEGPTFPEFFNSITNTFPFSCLSQFAI